MENKPSIPDKIKEEIWNFLAECKYDGKITKMNIDSIYDLFASQISKLEADLKEKEEEISSWKESKESWEYIANEKDSRIADLEKELDAKDVALTNLDWNISTQQQTINKLREGLEELVLVKQLKDLEGKTDEYLHRQPKAWEKAKQLLSETPQP